MVKMVRFGRFAIAYDDRPRQAEPSASPTSAHPDTGPPPRSFWAILRRIAFVVLVIIAILFVLMIIAIINTPPDDTQAVGQEGSTYQMDDPELAVATEVCSRFDVQDLAGKETRSLFLEGMQDQTRMLAVFGLMDPREFAQGFEAAEVTFSSVSGRRFSQSSFLCSASLKIDGSNATVGQDILQSPHFAWSVIFADAESDPTSANFTVLVEPESLAQGLLINGAPAEQFLAQENGPTDSAAE